MKKICSLFIAAAMIALMFVVAAVPVSAESLYIRKIVSVVYDDSGSMKGSKWSNANYAMQSFCGMLNSEDQLLITYMSRSNEGEEKPAEKVDLSSDGIQNSVDRIRNHSEKDDTPINAVELAAKRLAGVNDPNPNTQYWLVVITDGSFNEYSEEPVDEQREILNEKFAEYADMVMPNGTNPQITFLSIGKDVVSPDEDTEKGIFTYHAETSEHINREMSEMADKVSGRTRLDKKSIVMTDSRTVQVSSSIPLLNIAVFAHGSGAKVVKAVHNNEVDIPISRKVSMSFGDDDDLAGGAFLLGDSVKVIGFGTYEITFDRDVELDDLVILFEPALDMHMSISVNGTEIKDDKELKNLSEKDKISVSCKIYEMGTEKEISPSLLPPDTGYEITVSEAGKVVKRVQGKEMYLSEYELKNVETEIRAAAKIAGFNPIERSEKFTPAAYVPKVVYSVESAIVGNNSIKYDSIGKNTDTSVQFSFYADGELITDAETVKTLVPSVSVSPEGNGGKIEYTQDGKMVFVPDKAKIPSSVKGGYDVQVTCSIQDGASSSQSYRVLLSEYAVLPVAVSGSIVKTRFYGNETGASFYITKDGVRLGKAEIDKQMNAILNDEHGDLETQITVADDGTITVTPFSSEERRLTFWNWWINWAYYFGLEGEDVRIRFEHEFGEADSSIDVVGETVPYQLLNVYLPLLIELVALAFLITWIVLVVNKPKFAAGSILYVGDIFYNRSSCTHEIRNFSAVYLEKFNKIEKRNGRLKFKKEADVVPANGIRVRAEKGGDISCEMDFPWYKHRVIPSDYDLTDLTSPARIEEYFQKHRVLEIEEFETTETISGNFGRVMSPATAVRPKFIVIPDEANGTFMVDDRKVIKSGTIFIYTCG